MGIRDQERYDALLLEVREEFPRFAIIYKADSALHRAIDRTLRIVTLGKMTSYLTSYQTTIGSKVYVTESWRHLPPGQQYATLRHERVHLRQFRRWTVPGMALLYIFLPLPLGAAWCRMRFERAGYEESIRADAEIWGTEHVRTVWYREHLVEQFTGPSYGWMWPFRRSIERWYDRVLRSL